MHGGICRIAGGLVGVAICVGSMSVYGQEGSFLPMDPAYVAANQTATGLVSSNINADVLSRLEALEAALADDKKKDGWEDVSDQKWSGKVGGRIHGDTVMFTNQDAANLRYFFDQQNYFEFRRIWLSASGTGYGVYDYKLQLDFEPESQHDPPPHSPAVCFKDMYVGIHDIPILGYVRFGHFKAPFSLEELTSSNYLTFMERALPNIYAPGRKVGVAAYNHSPGDQLTWGYGVFFDDVSDTMHERISDVQGVEVGVRGVWTPYYELEGRGLLHVGFGYQYVDSRQGVQYQARPEIHEGSYFIDSGPCGGREYNRLNVELASVYGPFSIQYEFFYTTVNQRTPRPNVDLYGIYVYGSYFLTGENRGYNRHAGVFSRVKPHTNFWMVRTGDGTSAGWGAWELAARWSFLDMTDNILKHPEHGTLHDFTLGLNWYWNPNTRLMFNWIHAFGDIAGYAWAPVGKHEADILAMRMQVDF